MGIYLKLLLLELSSLEQNDFYEPDVDVGDDDTIVGELSEDLIRLFSLYKMTEKESLETVLEAKYGHPPDERRDELYHKAYELKQKADFINTLFWIELRDEHKLWNKPSIGVRKGRKIVISEDKGPFIAGFGFPSS